MLPNNLNGAFSQLDDEIVDDCGGGDLADVGEL